MLKDLLKKNRSYRRYDESYPLKKETLAELVELTRLCPSATNLQPLRYFLSVEPAVNAVILENTGWARLLGPSGTPQEGERPSGYIIILGDKRLTQNFWCDHGIAAQTILLGSVEIGLGGLIIGSVNKDGLQKALGIPEYYEIMLVIAIGKPIEKVVIEEIPPDGSYKYWRDEQKVHHVPKRPLSELIVDKF
jgi:nitroreductase